MKGKPDLSKKSVAESVDRLNLFHDFIVNYPIYHPTYKLDKSFSKHIDKALEHLEKGQQILIKKYGKNDSTRY